MSLFPRDEPSDRVLGSDAATRALSVTAVENDFVEGVYEKLASVYDVVFGPTLHPGRVQAIRRMGIAPGDSIIAPRTDSSASRFCGGSGAFRTTVSTCVLMRHASNHGRCELKCGQIPGTARPGTRLSGPCPPLPWVVHDAFHR